MPATTSGNASGKAGRPWWDRAIQALVPTALVAAMISYAFPFGFPVDFSPYSDSGFLAFFGGLAVLTEAPLDPFFWMFSLPLIAAVVGLIYQRRPGWIGALAPLICAVVGLAGLGSAYLWERWEPMSYGLFAAEVSFLIATVASAVRLIRLRRDRAMWDAKAEPRDEPAASAQQELVARYRKTW
jgi:NADH:ubiquinone oxidoreductase subunit 6 (subunit J)